jgi:prepilin-type N-terminal cleavage/methylation domain-containing protein
MDGKVQIPVSRHTVRAGAHVPAGGFTLIELLIVVAIIGILAGIAIVNFLEAQTRSKVSRAKADMKSVVTALEAYAVDHNSYPTYHYSNVSGAALEFHIGGTVPGFGIPDPAWDGRTPITTPVAYITSMPFDPFRAHLRGAPREVQEYLYVNWPYAVQQVSIMPMNLIFRYAQERYGAYRLHSRGPDGEGPDSGTPYDPTNGTTSDGDITYGPNTGFDRFVPFPP